MELMAKWKTDRLGEIATLQRGFDLPRRDRRTGPVPIVTSSGIEAWHSEAKVQGPGVVTGRYGTIGRVFFVDGPFWPLNTTLYVRDFHGNDPLFVAYLLRTVNFDEHSGKTGVPGVNRNDLHEIPVSLPSVKSEQEAIAEALSDADALIESLGQLLAKKRQIKQGAMQELLTGKKRLPKSERNLGYKQTVAGVIPKDWDLAPFTDAVELYIDYRGRTPRKLGLSWGGGDVLALSANNVLMGRIDPDKDPCYGSEELYRRWMVQGDCMPGDILLTMEAPLGNVAQIPDSARYILSQRVLLIRPKDRLDRDFLAHYMKGSFFQDKLSVNSTGSTAKGIQRKRLDELTIYFPSDKAEQEAISEILSNMDADIVALETKLAKLRQIKQGMMQELLTGRIRLVQQSATVVSFPVKQSANTPVNANHNAQINEAVVLAVLAHRFGSEQFPLGRFRRTKLSYLLHRHAERQVTGFMKKAAGPYSPQTRYGGAEKIALKNGYVCVHKTAKNEGFIAADNIAQAEGYFESWYGLQVLDWLKQFRYKKNEELELLTTVDMAIEDLRRDGKSVTVSAVKQIIHDSPEWKAKLDRAAFADSNITATIESCRQLFPVEE